jgi:pimeloyl-ACP methyl ester carboxylesterase
VTQLLLVLASSKLSWTGSNALSIIGYSLGGGIAANFAATFPDMVETLVLLAPAGLIRPENIGRGSRIIFASGLIPDRLLAVLTKWRLRQPIDKSVSKKRKPSTVEAVKAPLDGGAGKETYLDAATQEAIDPNADDSTSTPTQFEKDVISFVHWTLDNHDGFISAFLSTVRYAPMMDQHAYWRQLGKRKPGTTAVLLGRHDQLIQKEDYAEDALPLLGGKDNVFWRVVPGAHNFPFTHAQDALKSIYEFWGMSS